MSDKVGDEVVATRWIKPVVLAQALWWEIEDPMLEGGRWADRLSGVS